MADNPNIAYAHKSHEAFNKRFKQKLAPKPLDISGPWLSNEALNTLPRVRNDFRQTQSPANQPGPNRSQGDAGRGSAMVKQDKPQPAPHPSGPMGQDVDRQAFKERWLAEQRDAVLAQAAERQSTLEPAREMARVSPTPSRGPSR